jgi:hypothetical protein
VSKKKVREHVEELLEKYPKTRNDDKLLLLAYWKEVDNVEMNGKIMSISDFVAKATPAESITRARRLVQSEREDLQPIKEIKEIRIRRQKEMVDAVKQGQVV